VERTPIQVIWTRDDFRLVGGLMATLAAMVVLILSFPVSGEPQDRIAARSSDALTVHVAAEGLSAAPVVLGVGTPLELMNMSAQEVTVLVDGAEPSVTVPPGKVVGLDLAGVAPGQHELTAVTPEGAVSSAGLTVQDR
jgi:hypothetical protein